jgi:hypothetical protein
LRLRAEVRGGLVFLSGTVYRWEDLYQLARTLGRLPGVERVVFKDIKTDPHP